MTVQDLDAQKQEEQKKKQAALEEEARQKALKKSNSTENDDKEIEKPKSLVETIWERNHPEAVQKMQK